ncbi:hypothetical protein PJP10_31470, partial [Mycobacterium kansasii]
YECFTMKIHDTDNINFFQFRLHRHIEDMDMVDQETLTAGEEPSSCPSVLAVYPSGKGWSSGENHITLVVLLVNSATTKLYQKTAGWLLEKCVVMEQALLIWP